MTQSGSKSSTLTIDALLPELGPPPRDPPLGGRMFAGAAADDRLQLQFDSTFAPRLATRMRAALEAELALILIDEQEPGVAMLAITRKRGGDVELTLHGNFEPITRTLPWRDNEDALALEVALMASNLVRDQTRALLDTVADRPRAPSETAAAPETPPARADNAPLKEPDVATQSVQRASTERIALAERAAVLTPFVTARAAQSDLGIGWAAFIALAGTAGLIAIPLASHSDFKSGGAEAASYIAAGMWTASGTAALFLPQSYRTGLLIGGTSIGTGALMLSFALKNRAAESAQPVHEYLGILAAGHALSGSLWIASTLVHPPLPTAALSSDAARLSAKDARRNISSAELGAIERRYRDSETAVPQGFMFAPLALSVLAVTIGSAVDSRLNAEARGGLLCLGISQLTPSLIWLFSDRRSYPGYRAELEGLGLDVTVTPVAAPNTVALFARSVF